MFDARQAHKAEAAALTNLEDAADPLLEIRAAIEGWWRGTSVPGSGSVERLAANDRERTARGHDLNTMVHYGGEWYWGVDRLNRLTQRLDALGLRVIEAPPAFERRFDFLTAPSPATEPATELELFWSGRSPYAYLALERAYQLAEHHRIPLRLRPRLLRRSVEPGRRCGNRRRDEADRHRRRASLVFVPQRPDRQPLARRS